MTVVAGLAANNANKKAIFQNCAPFTNCTSKINNIEIDDGNDIVVVMPMYNFVGCSDIYLKTSRRLWQYYRDEPALDNNNNVIDSPVGNNNSISFKLKQKKTGETENDGTKEVEITVPPKYLSNFWKTLEIPLIDCEISF